MRDVILLDKIRGLKTQPGEYIEYDPNSNSYVYTDEHIISGDGYNKVSVVSYELSPEYMTGLAERGLVEYVGDEKQPSDKVNESEIDTFQSGILNTIEEMFDAQDRFMSFADSFFEDTRNRVIAALI
jgi:hypothetical protein